MRKSRRQASYRLRKKQIAHRIARACAAVALKGAPEELIGIVEQRIVAKLPTSLMRRLAAGDYGRPMREAMKLTVPFFT